MNLSSLSRAFWRRNKSRSPARSRLSVEPLEDRRVMSGTPVPLGSGKEIFVAPDGDDWNAGTVGDPFQTVRRALDAAAPGDVITLRNGVYQGGINVDIDALTIRSMPGEWAVVEAPLTPGENGLSSSVFRYSFDTQGGLLQNLEVVGGHYYGVMLWDWWDPTPGEGSTRVGPTGITLDGLKIHDTGVDAVKITPGANDITVQNCEIFNTGRRSKTSADGIDNNNGDRMVARNNYIHDLPGVGILTSGGAEDCLIEGNLVKNTAGAGINVGFYSELEWMEPDTNPSLFTSINNVARNNVVVGAGHAGIGVYASLNPVVANNTVVDAAADAQAPLQFGGVSIWVSNSAPSYAYVSSVNPVVVNNIITGAGDTRLVDVREGSVTGGLTLDYNVYHTTDLLGARFIDRNLTGDGTPERTFSQWKAAYGYDTHSVVANPQLDANYHMTAGSPAVGVAIPLATVTSDVDGNPRDNSPDVGADEFGAGPMRALPPAAFGAPTVEVAAKGYHDFEGNTVVVKVVRTGRTTDTVTVNYATADGTGKAGLDYTAVAGTLTFAPGETEKFVPVALLGDGLPEGDEHFVFVLSQPTTDGDLPVRLGHRNTASMTIDDLDTPPIVTYRTLWVAPNGSDVLGDGSEANPWKSLQFAAENVGPGDYVIVEPGLYDGMYVTVDGKPDARITFHAMPGVEINDPDPVIGKDGINLEGADYVTVEGFTVRGMPRAGIRSVVNEGAIIRGNVVDENGYWGILTGWSERILIENNVASRSKMEHGIYVSNSADDAVVRDNYVWGNKCSGIQFNADGALPGDGVHSRNLIEGNYITGNGVGGGAAINLDAVQDSVIQNNVVVDNHSTGIVLYVGYGAEPSTNNVVRNNTVVGAADARYALLMWNGSSGNTVVNNVLISGNPNRGSFTVEHGSEPAFSDYNVLGGVFQIDGYNKGFADWQQFTHGMDSHSIFASPAALFVDPAAGDYRLKPGSPAIDAASAVHAPAVDLYQEPRQAGAADIGALEAGTFPQTVGFDWAHSIGYEMTGQAEVTVTRYGSTAGTLSVDYATGDGTATPGGDYIPAAGTITFQPGERTKRFLVFVNDDAAIEPLETVGLHLANPVLTGAAGGVSLGVAASTLNISSDDAWKPGAVEFDTASVNVNEAAGIATLTVRRTGGSSGAVSVTYATGAYTPGKVPTWYSYHTLPLYSVDLATPASADDYTAVTGVVTFADGETEKTITVPLNDDVWYEGDEAFLVNLSNPTGGATLGKNATQKVRVQSDDAKLSGTFAFESATYSVTEGTPTVTLKVVRTGGANVPASVSLYDTAAPNGTAGSAWAGGDYGFLPGVLDFAAGETEKTIVVPVTDDNSTEGDEAFSVKLYSPTNDASVGAVATTVVTIHDNESTFYFSAPNGGSSFTVDENAGSLPVKVVRVGSLATPASLRVKTSAGSAAAGADFTATDVFVNFAPGEAFKIVNIPIVNDATVEGPESFSVGMSDVVGAQQGSWNWYATINDDDQSASNGKFEFAVGSTDVMESAGFVTLTVKRVDGAVGTATVKYTTSDGAPGLATAYAWSNYGYASGTLTFAPGETEKTITIPVTDNTSISADKGFTVSLSAPGGGAVLGGVKSTVVKIVNDDSQIEFQTSLFAATEGDQFVTVKVVRTGYLGNAASVDLAVTNWANDVWTDLEQPQSLTVTFAPGESVKVVQLKVIEDAKKEGEEWFNLKLSNVVGSKLGYLYYGNIKLLDND